MSKPTIALLLLLGAAPVRLFGAPPETAADRLTLTVVPGTDSVYAGDLLLLKSSVTNNTPSEN